MEENNTGGDFNKTELHRLRRSGSSHHCTRTNIVGMLVQKSSPYLFPCTIEYSLICAVTLYEMWKHIKNPTPIRTTHHHVCNQSMGRDYSSSSLGKNIYLVLGWLVYGRAFSTSLDAHFI
jgi:hypothetical protein